MASRQTLMSFQHFLPMHPTDPPHHHHHQHHLSLLKAKQAISPSPCSTSGLHSRWGIEKGENAGKERWNAERLGASRSGTEIMSSGRLWWKLRKLSGSSAGLCETAVWWLLLGMFLLSSASHATAEIPYNCEVFSAIEDANQTEGLLRTRHGSGSCFCQRINKRKAPRREAGIQAQSEACACSRGGHDI